jgi:hypothetical protein
MVPGEIIREVTPKIQRVAPGGPSGWSPVIAGLVLGLLGLGLPMIGVSVNLVLGGVTLFMAFGLIAWGCWIWEGKSPRRTKLRVVTICMIALAYFSLIGYQIRNQYKKDHPPVLPHSPASPLQPGIVIQQNADHSDCSNQIAQSGSQINCDTNKEHHDKAKANH